MHQTITRQFKALAYAIGFVAALSMPARAQGVFQVTDAFLKADVSPTGKCPLLVRFNGYITVNGPGTVKYTFTRSDGATSPIYTLTFKTAGTQSVSSDWTVGDAAALPHFEGWQAVRILAPNQSESSHKTGSFTINCAVATPQSPQPATSHARFRITINGFKVLHQTLDDLLERDGRGDEIFFLSQWRMTEGGRVLTSSELLRSRVMGDPTGRSDRVQAGSARPGVLGGMVGGLLTNDSFPNDPTVLSSSGTTDRAPMLLFDGELTSGQVLMVVPTIWEQDGPDDLLTVIGRAFNPFLDLGAHSVGPAPEYPGLLGRILSTAGDLGTDVHVARGYFGDPRDRPIGMSLGRVDYVFSPQRLSFSFADADEASRTRFGYGAGVIPITYKDTNELQGNYTIFVQIQRL
jgi:hypothetical protein